MVSDGEDKHWWATIWVELIGDSKSEVEMRKIKRADRKVKEDNKSDTRDGEKSLELKTLRKDST